MKHEVIKQDQHTESLVNTCFSGVVYMCEFAWINCSAAHGTKINRLLAFMLQASGFRNLQIRCKIFSELKCLELVIQNVALKKKWA